MIAPRRAGLRRSMNVWRRLDAMSRHAWPATLMFLGLLAIGIPFGIPGQAELRPAYAMACVFFWSLYRPASMPAPVVAGAGLLLDLLGMSPLGMWAVLLLVLQGSTLAARRRLIPQSFLLVWLVFFAFAAAGAELAWLLQSLLELKMLPMGPEGIVCLAAAGVYPALAGFFIRAHRGSAAAELA
jgi:rod shape-determining protein MreD